MNREQEIINLIRTRLPSCKNMIVGNGDDAAVIAAPEGPIVITTDAFTEHVHFDCSSTAAEDIGYKVIVATISDIVAMGATPKHLTISANIPHRFDLNWLDALAQGMSRACREYCLTVIGGDTTRSASHLTISVTSLGQLISHKALTQSTAQPTQKVAVSRPVGGALAGLLLTQGPKQQTDHAWAKKLLTSFRRPKLELELMHWLTQRKELGAVTDISDGLVEDLKKISRNSSCGFRISVEDIPEPAELKDFLAQTEYSSSDLVLHSGEEFSLLFTFTDSRKFCEDFYQEFGHTPYVIGEVVTEPTRFFINGVEIATDSPLAFRH